ncbi:Panacea domain-containing protein [Thermosipho atlanticus]|uniref:Antitoxin SocA-like Panacea domain-containing protein n=1 Tax=Thermosipho atlanticus DSM 15807 TaxID=1123380 RepID=A0A1M5RMQ0_9BACT|nr:Panacea domain-containing protein [Thermosipho atlanticus]SHH27338.1 Protein of unknown function [Thermosipho atlanticus DSM 15807]
MTKIAEKNKKALQIIVELLRNTEPLIKTKLVKLLFLIDMKFLEIYGKKMSELTYVRYFYGPYSRDIDYLLTFLNAKGVISYEEHINSDGKTYYLIELSNNEKYNEVSKSLGEKERKIIKEIADRYSKKDLSKILEEVYNIPKVKNKNFGEEII